MKLGDRMMQPVWLPLAFGGCLGSKAGEEGNKSPPLFSSSSRAVVEGILMNSTCGEGPDPW